MAVITISRQYGSKGDEIARRVCDILGYRYFDKRLMAEVASELNLSPEKLVDFSDEHYKVRGFLDRLLDRTRTLAQIDTWDEEATGQEQRWTHELNEEECVELVRRVVRAVYRQGNVVIMGRGGQAILRNMPDVLHLRIEATLGSRVMWVKSQKNLSVAEAEALTRERDKAASAYLKRFYDIDWSNSMLYHMVLNTSKWDIEAAAQIIVSAVSHLRQRPAV
ncbi:MAG: AAA family ATPase [Anaerolineae bacterium]